MNKRTLTLMAMVLMAATAVTAAAALADSDDRCRPQELRWHLCKLPVAPLVAEQAAIAANKATLLKLRRPLPQRPIPLPPPPIDVRIVK